MITGASITGFAYIFTSVPQIPATSTLSSAPSSGMSGMGNSRNSVRLGPVRTAASTRSFMEGESTAKGLKDYPFGYRCADAPPDGDSDPGKQCGAEERDGHAARVRVRVRGGVPADPRLPPDGPRARVRRLRDGVHDV